jgi:hypothetical protein
MLLAGNIGVATCELSAVAHNKQAAVSGKPRNFILNVYDDIPVQA